MSWMWKQIYAGNRPGGNYAVIEEFKGDKLGRKVVEMATLKSGDMVISRNLNHSRACEVAMGR